VIAGAVLDGGRLLVVSKHAAPDVFFLPGGKPQAGRGAAALPSAAGARPARPRHPAPAPRGPAVTPLPAGREETAARPPMIAV